MATRRRELPLLRGDCAPGGALHVRPCPFAACRYHLALEVPSCALDVADEGPQEYKRLAKLMGVSRQRIQQMERKALRKLRARASRFDVTPEDIDVFIARHRHMLDSDEGEE